ncbi:hypothetical protein QOT17_012636 [Balamuthia mandrillaris]
MLKRASNHQPSTQNQPNRWNGIAADPTLWHALFQRHCLETGAEEPAFTRPEEQRQYLVRHAMVGFVGRKARQQYDEYCALLHQKFRSRKALPARSRSKRAKLVVVGGSGVGKISCLSTHVTGQFSSDERPTVDMKNCQSVGFVSSFIKLKGTASLGNKTGTCWHKHVSGDVLHRGSRVLSVVPLLKEHWPDVPVMLVGSKVDVLNDADALRHLSSSSENETPGGSLCITLQQSLALAKRIRAWAFVPISSLMQENLELLFQEAIRGALYPEQGPILPLRHKPLRYLCRASVVCKRWNGIAADLTLWHALFQRHCLETGEEEPAFTRPEEQRQYLMRHAMVGFVGRKARQQYDEYCTLLHQKLQSRRPLPKPYTTAKKAKIVAVGGSGVGKISCLSTHVSGRFNSDIHPTIDHKNCPSVGFVSAFIKLQQGSLRSKSRACDGVRMFLVMFSIVDPKSFLFVEEQVVPVLKEHWPGVPMILVGSKMDVLNDADALRHLSRENKEPASPICVTLEQSLALAKRIGAWAFVPISSLMQENLELLFQEAIRGALYPEQGPILPLIYRHYLYSQRYLEGREPAMKMERIEQSSVRW